MHFFPCILDAAFRQKFVLASEEQSSSPKLQYYCYYSCQNSVNKSRWHAAVVYQGLFFPKGERQQKTVLPLLQQQQKQLFSCAEHAIFLNDETRGSLDHVYYIQQGVPKTLILARKFKVIFQFGYFFINWLLWLLFYWWLFFLALSIVNCEKV